jgi:hypothetical protein
MPSVQASKLFERTRMGCASQPTRYTRCDLRLQAVVVSMETCNDLRCLPTLLALRSTCSRDSPLLRIFPPEHPAFAALRVQSDVVGMRYPQPMGFSILTRGVFGHYSSCNPCLPRASGEGSVRVAPDRHLIGKQGYPGHPPASFVQIAHQPAQRNSASRSACHRA